MYFKIYLKRKQLFYIVTIFHNINIHYSTEIFLRHANLTDTLVTDLFKAFIIYPPPPPHRRSVIETSRSLKELFHEARERASKALGFAKMLRKVRSLGTVFALWFVTMMCNFNVLLYFYSGSWDCCRIQVNQWSSLPPPSTEGQELRQSIKAFLYINDILL